MNQHRTAATLLCQPCTGCWYNQMCTTAWLSAQTSNGCNENFLSACDVSWCSAPASRYSAVLIPALLCCAVQCCAGLFLFHLLLANDVSICHVPLRSQCTLQGSTVNAAGFDMADQLAMFSSNSRCILSADVKIFKKPQEQNCAALLAFVSMLWCTEALPLFITSTLIPLLAGRLLCMLSCK